jgi:hypothetical protein
MLQKPKRYNAIDYSIDELFTAVEELIDVVNAQQERILELGQSSIDNKLKVGTIIEELEELNIKLQTLPNK